MKGFIDKDIKNNFDLICEKVLNNTREISA